MNERDMARIFSAADQLLISGKRPDVGAISAQVELAQGEIEQLLERWWHALPGRIQLGDRNARAFPDMPDTLAQSFMRVWQQAVQEAQANVRRDRQQHEVGEEESRRINEEALRQSQGVYQELEARYRELGVRLEQSEQHGKSLEAEIAVLKNNLSTETNERKREEQLRANLDHELNQLRKQYEDYRRSTEQRLKEEQRKGVEAMAKAEVEVRHFRSMLDKVRDEAGRKEAALTRDLHEHQGELARKEVKLETQASQIKALETELNAIKQDVGVQHRDLTKINSALLSESNKNKRLEDKIKELSEELQRSNQRALTAGSDGARRENALRTQLKERDEALMKAQARIAALEKRSVTQDEEIRRLSARL
ncbi:DNA-binding protein [Marinobacterium sp. D7]|uniref:DNA-binding protein n=1 Tax=Marinobacterium ramblicola TaxID=2849041 RepID=UPI001C2CC711|nr:DNA-binding protein [Marinobacterium ramblicola]